MKRFAIIGAVFASFLFCGQVFAQNDTQTFQVTVNSNLTITAPADPSAITEANADSDTAFAAQTWQITCNDEDGGTATFAVSNVFVHTTNSAFRADVQLDLALGTVEGDWGVVIGQGSDTTNYSGSDLVADVSASSTIPSDADLNLTVTFKNTNSSLLASGTYSVTVTGTLAAN